MIGPCMCGDIHCPSCGPAQGYNAESEEIIDFIEGYMDANLHVNAELDVNAVSEMIEMIAATRAMGARLMIIGLGGSAANASHAVNDFRKLCGVDAFTPVDNVAELTARMNDEGADTIFDSYLDRLTAADALLVLSVGGGTPTVSPAIYKACMVAREKGAKVMGIVGPNGGGVAEYGHTVLKIPVATKELVTPIVEAWQSVVLHMIVSAPTLKRSATKW